MKHDECYNLNCRICFTEDKKRRRNQIKIASAYYCSKCKKVFFDGAEGILYKVYGMGTTICLCETCFEDSFPKKTFTEKIKDVFSK